MPLLPYTLNGCRERVCTRPDTLPENSSIITETLNYTDFRVDAECDDEYSGTLTITPCDNHNEPYTIVGECFRNDDVCSSVDCPSGKYHKINEIDGNVRTPDNILLTNSQGETITINSERIDHCCQTTQPTCQTWGGSDQLYGIEDKCRLSMNISISKNQDGGYVIPANLIVSNPQTLLYTDGETNNIPGNEDNICCGEITDMCKNNTIIPDYNCLDHNMSSKTTNSELGDCDNSPTCSQDSVTTCCKNICCDEITGMCIGNTDPTSEPNIDCDFIGNYSDTRVKNVINYDDCSSGNTTCGVMIDKQEKSTIEGDTKAECCDLISDKCSGNTDTRDDYSCPSGKTVNSNTCDDSGDCTGDGCCSENKCCDFATCGGMNYVCPQSKVSINSGTRITQDMIDNGTIEETCCELRTCENSYSGSCPYGKCNYTPCGETCSSSDCCAPPPDCDGSSKCPCTNIITCGSSDSFIDTRRNYDPSITGSETTCCVSPDSSSIDSVISFDNCDDVRAFCSSDNSALAIELTDALTDGDGLSEYITVDCEAARAECDISCDTASPPITERFTNMGIFENYYLRENMNNIIVEGVQNSNEYNIPISISISPKSENVTISKTEMEQKLESGVKLSMLSSEIKKINKKKEKEESKQKNIFTIVSRMVALFVIVGIILFGIYKFKSKNPLEELLS